jgi:hypothetical protein
MCREGKLLATVSVTWFTVKMNAGVPGDNQATNDLGCVKG